MKQMIGLIILYLWIGFCCGVHIKYIDKNKTLSLWKIAVAWLPIVYGNQEIKTWTYKK